MKLCFIIGQEIIGMMFAWSLPPPKHPQGLKAPSVLGSVQEMRRQRLQSAADTLRLLCCGWYELREFSFPWTGKGSLSWAASLPSTSTAGAQCLSQFKNFLSALQMKLFACESESACSAQLCLILTTKIPEKVTYSLQNRSVPLLPWEVKQNFIEFIAGGELWGKGGWGVNTSITSVLSGILQPPGPVSVWLLV